MGIAALENRDQPAQNWKRVIEERQRLTGELESRGFTVLPSETNFLLVEPKGSIDAQSIYRSLKARDVFVRYFDQDRINDKLRITVGTHEQNDRLLHELDQVITS